MVLHHVTVFHSDANIVTSTVGVAVLSANTFGEVVFGEHAVIQICATHLHTLFVLYELLAWHQST